MASTTVTFFDKAPLEVQNLAAIIARGAAPEPADLAALPDDALNASWGQPEPKNKPIFGHTLLREAVVQRNIEASRALIAAGADIGFNGGELPFLAGRMDNKDQRRLWFPDYSDGLPFLQLWLDNDGSPNAQSPWDGTPLLSHLPGNNLEAVLFLIENGADPWATQVTSIGSTGYVFRSRPYFEGLANANSIAQEVSFRIANLGHYKNGPPDVIDRIVERYERTAEQFNDTSGPDGLHVVWMMQRTLPLIYEQLGRTPGQEVAKLLAIEVPEGIGGFWLGPDEIRSADIESQRPLNDNQRGSQRWGTP